MQNPKAISLETLPVKYTRVPAHLPVDDTSDLITAISIGLHHDIRRAKISMREDTLPRDERRGQSTQKLEIGLASNRGIGVLEIPELGTRVEGRFADPGVSSGVLASLACHSAEWELGRALQLSEVGEDGV
jgi:hypothetical protein